MCVCGGGGPERAARHPDAQLSMFSFLIVAGALDVLFVYFFNIKMCTVDKHEKKQFCIKRQKKNFKQIIHVYDGMPTRTSAGASA